MTMTGRATDGGRPPGVQGKSHGLFWAQNHGSLCQTTRIEILTADTKLSCSLRRPASTASSPF